MFDLDTLPFELVFVGFVLAMLGLVLGVAAAARAYRSRPRAVVAIGLFLLLAVPVTAYALVGPKNLDGQMRVASYTFPLYAIPDTTEVVVDVDGVLAAPTIWSGSAAQDVSQTDGVQIGTLPWPSKLSIVLIDGGSASGALTCTSITITGVDQFGRTNRETVSTITETAQKTERVYEQVSSYSTSGCAIASGGDTSDVIRISNSSSVGLPRKLRTYADIVALCLRDDSVTAGDGASSICFRGSGTITGSRESLQEQGSVDLDDSAIDMSDSDFDTAVQNNVDQIWVRIRASDPPSL